MNVSECLDKEYRLKETKLEADSVEEIELIQSIANLLYRSKSIRNSIDIIDSLANSEWCIRHSNPKQVLWNYSDKSIETILEEENKKEKGKDYFEITL